MTPIEMSISVPTGFSDKADQRTVTVLSFAYGKHRDAGGYNRQGECMLAVCIDRDDVVAVPIHWLSPPQPIKGITQDEQ